MQNEGRDHPAWKSVVAEMRVVTLSAPLQALVPMLAIPSLSKSTRGLTLIPGSGGKLVGALLLAAAGVLGFLLYESVGPVAAALSVWFVGSAGGASLAASMKPTAFVKPICVRCRLLPVIKEHEAIHLTGVVSEKAVWDSMKSRHSAESLGLRGDPAICSFCPIPKRLAE
ncbi:MAG: hypothetical protein JRN21_03430 [Nitrososphaerota archaeon]|nr:hypothetical protein [Nitrososphaerota archaeon]